MDFDETDRAAGAIPGLEDSDPDRPTGEFVPAVLDRTVIAVPLLRRIAAETKAMAADASLKPTLYPVIIDPNNNYRGSGNARTRIAALIKQAVASNGQGINQGIDRPKTNLSSQYIFADLTGPVIQEVVRLDNASMPAVADEHPGAVTGSRAIYSIWPDFAVQALLTKSAVTVKADA